MKSSTTTNNLSPKKSIRLLPGIIIVSLQWICWLIVPYFVYGMIATATMVFSSLLGGFALLIWWSFFSRTKRLERLIGLAVIIICLMILPQFCHDSIHTGMDGLMFFIYAVPSLSLALVLWAAISNRIAQNYKLLTLTFAIILSGSIWLFVRSNGLNGNAKADFVWRWNEPNGENFLAQKEDDPDLNTSSLFTNTTAEWPGFRGPTRDGIIKNTKIETNWAVERPAELWRKPVGSGCSSFAVQGNYFFTQEQRGEFEIVSCYKLSTGELVWAHQDSARFYDQHAGAGPRSTPTLSQGKVFTLGATGILNVLKANDGSLIWSTNSASDTNAKDSGWGFASSPLVVNNLVIVAAAANLIAYHINSGNEIWTYSDSTDSYSSAHLCTIEGQQQIIFMTGNGATGIDIITGNPLWNHSWPCETRILQPVVLGNQEILMNSGQKRGVRKIKIEKQAESWNCKVLWTSTQIRPDFNDFVVHKGHIYGFDGPNLACIDLKNGERKWRGSRYGGQLILLAEQDLLLILTEKGKIVLAKADPGEFKELSKMEAINGKTWNHPVIVDDVLLVRNAKEMVAYHLSIVG